MHEQSKWPPSSVCFLSFIQTISLCQNDSLRSSANPRWFPAPWGSVSETALQSLDVLPTTLSLPTQQAQTLPTLLNVLQGPSSARCLLAHPQASVCTLPTRRLDWTEVCIWLMFWTQTLLSEERALPCQELRWLRKDADPADESRWGGWDVMVDLSGPEGGGEVGQHFSTGNYLEAWPNKKKVSALQRAQEGHRCNGEFWSRGMSLAVWWLGLVMSTAGGVSLNPGQWTRILQTLRPPLPSPPNLVLVLCGLKKKTFDDLPVRTTVIENTKKKRQSLHQGVYNLHLEIKHL